MAANSPETPTSDIRNVVLLGHGGSGKTTLVDAISYISGATSRRGSVTAGNAHTDFAQEEKDHGVSINVAVARAPWMGRTLNLVDAPGYFDFYGDVHAGVRVADGALIVLNAASGVDVGTQKVWSLAEERGLPRILFVTGMDRENASFTDTFRKIKEVLSPAAIPVEVPIGSGADFRGIVNLFSERAHIYRSGSDTGEYDETEIPDEVRPGAEEYGTELIETIATTDDTLLEAYLEGEELDRAAVLSALSGAMGDGEIFPVFCGSGATGHGVRAVMSKLVELMPSPAEAGPYTLEQSDGPDALVGDDGEPLAALVFKTASEPHTGELSYFRVYGGTLANGDNVYNPNRQASERITHLSVANGASRTEVSRLHAGDIGVVAKLRDTHTGDTLCSSSTPLRLPGIDFPAPDISVAVRPVHRGQEDKLGSGLHAIHEEDPTFSASYDAELGQTIARGLGELHLSVCLEKLQRKYGVQVETEEPRIPYRETLTRQAEGRARHKKQTGGRGQFGECSIRLQPLPRGSGYEFVDSIKGGVIPSKFVPAVDEGIREAAQDGILAGYPVVDFRAEVFDGSHHSVDSSEQAFKVAGSMAFKKVARQARLLLLEPIMEVEVRTPEQYMGDVIGDLNQRRGKVVGMDSDGPFQIVKAQVPEAELYKYSAAIRSLTHGEGTHRRSPMGYEPVPAQVAEKIIAREREEKAS